MFKKFINLLKDFLSTNKTKESEMSDLSASSFIAPSPGFVLPTAVDVEPAPAPAPVAVASTGVSDFEKALAYVEHGVSVLGEEAKDELIALAKKYL